MNATQEEVRTKSGFAISSIEAHEEVKPSKEAQWEMIADAMRQIGLDVTTRQLGNYSKLELDYHTVARRMSEMEKAGIVRVTGRKANAPKRPLLWKLTDAYKNITKASKN